MQITDIGVVPVEMAITPLEDGGVAPYVSRDHEHERIQRTLIEVETSDGVSGWGEIRTPFDSHAVAEALVSEVLAPALVGRSVAETGGLADEFAFTYMAMDPVLGGVEMAMWDAHGKSLGVPVSSLLGGRQVDSVPVAFVLGILDEERSRAHARRALDAGYDVLKTKAGRNWRDDVDRLVAMDDAVDGRLGFRVDPNMGWSVDEAVRAGARLEDAGVYLQYLEQPIRVDSFGSLGQLRSRLRTPVAINEDTYVRRNLYQAVTADAIDVGVVDMVPAGGISQLLDLCGVAGEAGIPLVHHCGFDLGIKTAAVLQVCASCPALSLPPDTAYYAWPDDVIESPLSVDDGEMAVPDGPGFGVTVDRAKLDEYRVDR